jgi:hypothetical protein
MDTICSKSERLLKSADSPVSLESDFTVDDTHGRFATMSSPFDGYTATYSRRTDCPSLWLASWSMLVLTRYFSHGRRSRVSLRWEGWSLVP